MNPRVDWFCRVVSRLFYLIPFFACLHAAEISTILGTGKAGFSGDGGPAEEAEIRGPFGVVRGPDGCLYVCDTYNHCMRKIDAQGIVSTVVGRAGKRDMPEMGGMQQKLY